MHIVDKQRVKNDVESVDKDFDAFTIARDRARTTAIQNIEPFGTSDGILNDSKHVNGISMSHVVLLVMKSAACVYLKL